MKELAYDNHLRDIMNRLTSYALKPTFIDGNIEEGFIFPEITTLDAARWIDKKRNSLLNSEKTPEEKVAKLELLTPELAKEKISHYKNKFH